jgi:hypothetical protein
MMWLKNIVLVTVGTLGLAACGADMVAPTAPSAVGLSAEVRSAIDVAIQDEYRAETIYEGVVGDFGPLLPFVNVLSAEQRHSASLVQLLTNRGLNAPANGWSVSTVPHFGTMPEACGAAVIAERDNIAMYDRLLPLGERRWRTTCQPSNRAREHPDELQCRGRSFGRSDLGPAGSHRRARVSRARRRGSPTAPSPTPSVARLTAGCPPTTRRTREIAYNE